jgi:sec-independent protein translocase protein TatA
MFDIGLQELVLIFVIALLVFGPKNLPQLGRSLGRAMREFRKASDEFRSTIETNLQLNEPDPPPSYGPSYGSSFESASTEEASASLTAAESPEPLAVPAAGEPEGPASGESPPAEPYIAQRGARLFHRRDCGWARRISEAERLYFKRVSDAREQGLLVCPSCEPWEPA